MGAFDEGDSGEENNKPLLGFLKRSLNSGESSSAHQPNGTHDSIGVRESSDKDSMVETGLLEARAANMEEAKDVKRMVESGQRKMSLLNEARE